MDAREGATLALELVLTGAIDALTLVAPRWRARAAGNISEQRAREQRWLENLESAWGQSRWHAPPRLFLAHGLQDRESDPEESYRLIELFQGAMRPLSLQLYPAGGHRLQASRLRRHLYQSLIVFLRQRLMRSEGDLLPEEQPGGSSFAPSPRSDR